MQDHLTSVREALLLSLGRAVEAILAQDNFAEILDEFLEGRATIMLGLKTVTVAPLAYEELAALALKACPGEDDPPIGLYL